MQPRRKSSRAYHILFLGLFWIVWKDIKTWH